MVAGQTVIGLPVKLLLHEYVMHPLAVSVTHDPAHIVTGLGTMVITGFGCTVTVTKLVDEQLPVVPVTV